MTHYDVKRLALVLSIQAEIEGMKSENLLREQNQESPAYNGADFSEKAFELENLANAHDEQI